MPSPQRRRPDNSIPRPGAQAVIKPPNTYSRAATISSRLLPLISKSKKQNEKHSFIDSQNHSINTITKKCTQKICNWVDKDGTKKSSIERTTYLYKRIQCDNSLTHLYAEVNHENSYKISIHKFQPYHKTKLNSRQVEPCNPAKLR